MNEETIKLVKQLLNTPKKIVVVGHKNPDGDALGSCLGLSIFLKHLGHYPTVIMPNDFPDFLKWLPENESIVIHEKEVEKSTEAIENAEVIFTLDFNMLNRVGDLEVPLKESSASFIIINNPGITLRQPIVIQL